MPLQLSLTHIGRYAQVNASPAASQTSPLAPPAAEESRAAQLQLTHERILALDGGLSRIEQLLATSQIERKPGTATAVSHAPLDLAQASPTVLQSGAEVNATATSYSPFGPVFAGSGNSTALPTLDGVYDGSNGTDTLTFKVTRGGEHGQDKLRIKVFDSNGDELETIKIEKDHPIDREYTLSNGLIFTLGAGDLVEDDSFTLDVFDDVGSVVDTAKPFDGTRNERPNFEYGVQVTAGSFVLNGVTIDVYADDSIDSMITRINASGAGVDASFEVATEQVVLTQRTLGPDHDIVVENDTSGFVAATKLTGLAIPGKDAEAELVLEQTQRFGSVSGGAVTINGVDIAIDPQADTLNDIIGRINAADAKVTASLIHEGQRFLLRADEPGKSIVLGDGNTGLVAALDLDEGTHRAPSGRGGLARDESVQLTEAVELVALTLNAIFDDDQNLLPSDASLVQLRAQLENAVTEATDPAEGALFARTPVGMQFALHESLLAHSDFVTVDSEELGGVLQSQIDVAREFFQGEDAGRETGMLPLLRGALGGYALTYGPQFSSLGLLLNVVA